MDAADRPVPRFPPRIEASVRARIADALRALACDSNDVGLTQGAAGADILCAEECLRRGVRLQLLLPMPEDEFIAASITTSAHAEDWRRRYLAVKAASLAPPPHLPPAAGDPYRRCNRWLIDTAQASGADEVHLLVVWDGSSADGPGGTSDLVADVTRMGGRLHWIDTRTRS